MKLITEQAQVFIDGRLIRLDSPRVVLVSDEDFRGVRVTLLVDFSEPLGRPGMAKGAPVDVFVYTPEGLLKTEYTGRVPSKTGDTHDLCAGFVFESFFQKDDHFGDHFFIELND